jgi:hypothetical protein
MKPWKEIFVNVRFGLRKALGIRHWALVISATVRWIGRQGLAF